MRDFSEIMDDIRNQSFAEYLQGIDFISFFDEHVMPRRGGGRDRMSPKVYRKTFITEIDTIKESLRNGNYHFSPYNEKLILKGRGRYPRVISIPIVRDRFVLTLLNSFLQRKLGLHRRTANTYIWSINEYAKNYRQINYFKTDISAFFDSIQHSKLLELLNTTIDVCAFRLVKNAIETPTLPPGHSPKDQNTIGVPQGLSISSILAELYMLQFDKIISQEVESSGGIYLRYVDDIFILSPVAKDWAKIIDSNFKAEGLGLVMSEGKTKFGLLGEHPVEYVGYKFSKFGISVKDANVRAFSDRLASRCIRFKAQWEHESLRPKFVLDIDDFLEYSEIEINLLISGFRIKNHNYGWLPYFQQITDLRILYELDIVVKRIIDGTPLQNRLNSFVKTYFALRRNGGQPYVYDFNKAITTVQKRVILSKLGRLSPKENYQDTTINRFFDVLMADLTRESVKDLKELS